MIVGIGTDLVQVTRIREVVARQGTRFVNRILTPHEQEIFAGKKDGAAYLAKRFAAKEAASKALGTGIGQISWQDLEVTNDEAGAPLLTMTGMAENRLKEKGGRRVLISLSDERDYVSAFVVLDSGD